jgi:hypothetical protein
MRQFRTAVDKPVGDWFDKSEVSLLQRARLGVRKPLLHDFDKAGCQWGAGMPCECNLAEGHQEPDVMR